MFDFLKKKKPEDKSFHSYACLRCKTFSVNSHQSLTPQEDFEAHIAHCGKGDGNALFIDDATDEEIEDRPHAERRKFLGIF